MTPPKLNLSDYIGKDKIAIHCPDFEDVKPLMELFDRHGLSWGAAKYNVDGNDFWSFNREKTVYKPNEALYDTIDNGFLKDYTILQAKDFLPNSCIEKIDPLPCAHNEIQFTYDDLVLLIDELKEYTRESHSILGRDERESSELVDIFIQSKKQIECP